MLAIRLRLVMDKFIFPNHSAFLKRRMLVDDVVAVNEVVDLAKKSKKVVCILKVDFEKVYVSVS